MRQPRGFYRPRNMPGFRGWFRKRLVPLMDRAAQTRLRFALIATIVVSALFGIAVFSGEGWFWFIALATVIVLLPLLATGIILLLARVGLIDEDAAGRMGCLHGLGLAALPVLVLALYVFPDGPIGILGLPALILGSVYGGDVLMAIAFRLGLTKRRSILNRTRGSRRLPEVSVLREPGRAAISGAMGAYMGLLSVTERERYRPLQAIGRLFLIATLPMFMVGVIGIGFAIGGYDGTALITIGFVGTGLCLAFGLGLGMWDDRP